MGSEVVTDEATAVFEGMLLEQTTQLSGMSLNNFKESIQEDFGMVNSDPDVQGFKSSCIEAVKVNWLIFIAFILSTLKLLTASISVELYVSCGNVLSSMHRTACLYHAYATN